MSWAPGLIWQWKTCSSDITGSGFRDQGLGFRVQGLGFRVQGFFRVAVKEFEPIYHNIGIW